MSLRVNDKPDESLLDKQKSTEDSNSCYCIQMAKTYWKQGSRPAALCLMLAYMTVLGFDGVSNVQDFTLSILDPNKLWKGEWNVRRYTWIV